MNIIVPVKQVVDLVEELEIDESRKSLDPGCLRFILNESDNHAIEQALLVKEKTGGTVTVVGLDMREVDEPLFTAQAKGADKILKFTGDYHEDINSRTFAKILAGNMAAMTFDVILIGVQASDDMDGQVGPVLASILKLPYVGVISSLEIEPSTKKAKVLKEYPGGVLAELEISLPAVIGIQSAEQTPRYVAYSKVRAAMKSGSVEEVEVKDTEPVAPLDIKEMRKPEAAKEVKMIEGSEEDIAKALADIIMEKIKV
jgi:electron transfer flavoprotein beta subunit